MTKHSMKQWAALAVIGMVTAWPHYGCDARRRGGGCAYGTLPCAHAQVHDVPST